MTWLLVCLSRSHARLQGLQARNVNLIAVTLFAFAGVVRAHEPQAAFTLKNGWVECLVEQDGRPAANATLVILDAQGNKFADGETDDTGLAQFPAPAGSSFTVEIKTAGARSADPIRIMKVGTRIEPARVLLSYGLRPCCRVLVNRDKAWKANGPIASASDRLLLWFAGAATVCAALGVIVFIRMPKRGCADGST